MRIWWCQEHGCQAPENGFGSTPLCWRSMRAHGLKPKPAITDCRMVPMRLIPDNAETVDREALAAALDRFTLNWQSGDFKLVATAARAYLAALDGETP